MKSDRTKHFTTGRGFCARVSQLWVLSLLSTPAWALEVNISSHLESVTTLHQGKPVVIQRNQDQMNTIAADFMMTSRPCPPFCVQPMQAAEGVATIGELEMLDYLKRLGAGDQQVLVIDSRTADQVARGTIPGAVNIPWSQLSDSVGGADPFTVKDLLSRFGVQEWEGIWDFSQAKTLVLFCNGAWCGQSPLNIRALVKYGYPPARLKWYRGGLQMWETLGLTTVRGDEISP